ncbi:MAG: GAF domain-containing protein, partial [Leptospirales bacterium]|nr:GAF domain-containing protein [Leptospirales bacterium]
MINVKSNKPKQKSKIATRAGQINNILLIMILILMTAIAAKIVHNINNDNAKHLSKAYSMEAAQMFHLQISHNLPLVRKASRSKALANWFANEGNNAKRAAAFDDMIDYAGLLQDGYVYFGINESKNEYTIEGRTAYKDFVPKGRLNPSNDSNAWYFECIDSENEYTIKIVTEKNTNIWRLRISHKITANGKFTGVLSSVHRIPDVFYSVFDKDDINKFRGYIINRHGVIRSDSTAYGIYSEEKTNHIHEESSDTVFASAFASYLGRINGLFNEFSEPEIIKLSEGGHYEYAVIHPISHTDWSVVVFYNGHVLSGITNILPLVIVMLAALFLYVAGRTALMDRLVYTPLNRLMRDISEGKSADADFYGSNRNDEIGELARAIQNATYEQQHQEKLIHAVNGTAAVLFVATEVENIYTLLLDSMEIIGRCVGVDRIHIWRNETIDGIFCYVNQVQWMRERSQLIKLPAEKYPYSENPEWERKFSKNEYVNGPVSNLTRQEQNILDPIGVKSILAIPLYMQGQFYGFCSFEDCHREYTFTDDEIEILRSAGLIIISAINRNTQAMQLRKAHEYNKLMLDSTPLGCHIWDKNLNIIDCNDEAVRLFNLKDKQEYLNRFFDLSPKYQPNGNLSSDTRALYIKKAFEEGKYIFKWMYQTLDGSPLPAEVTLIRLPYEDNFIIVGYIQDLREHERMMNEIQQHDNLLYAVNSAAIVMLSTEEKNFDVSLHKGMELMGHCVDVDRVQIWQNEIINDELHFSLKYEWISDYGRETDPVHTNLKLPYNVMPEWKEKFSRGECINKSFPELSTEEQKFFSPYDINSIVIIPLFLQNQLWGFFCIADCRKDRTFTEDEIDILRSGSLMMISVMNRNIQAMLLRQAHERNQIILDAMPMAYQLWRRNGNIFDCNEEAVKLFKMKDKQDFMDRFFELSPKYQPDGQLSYEKAIFNLEKALDEGRSVFEFMHRMSDGTPVLTEVTAVRVRLGDEDVVASYARDLREYKQMMQEIDRRDYLLNIVNNAATILLQSETEKFESDLNNCMGM